MEKKCKQCPFREDSHFQFVTSSLPCLCRLNFTSFTEKIATAFAKCTLTVGWFLLDSVIHLSGPEDTHPYTPLVLFSELWFSSGKAALEGSNKAQSYYLIVYFGCGMHHREI